MSGAMVFDAPESINAYRMLTILARLRLEVRTGMTSRMKCTPVIRDILGSKTRNKKKLYREFEDYLLDAGIASQRYEV